MKNRKGIITIRDNHFDDIDTCYSFLKEVFFQFVPVKIETDWNGRIYFGYSEHFDEVVEGCIIPHYTVMVTKVDEIGNDGYEIKFDKV